MSSHDPAVSTRRQGLSERQESFAQCQEASLERSTNHHHLVIRPEDVWFAILTQFSHYVNAHAEQMQGKFVAHNGKVNIVLEYNPFSVDGFDFSQFALDIARVLGELAPEFTTTTDNDRVVASVIMMASVELLGEKADYEVVVLRRVGKLREYGDEAARFAALLDPVLRRFVRSFNAPDATDVLKFWRTVFDCDDSGCGVEWCTGWITAFCFWPKVKGFPFYLISTNTFG
ncbi:hypothetical protein BX600DRAFT_524997 [Xylariales sp. PMI_506]|nr:hypothetical protein BX600DRAFT_524997 [Xylariales sp. PMI_506]